MARQGKTGIDYFSHDIDLMQDKKIKIIKAKHGLLGYAVYLRLLEEIYRAKGYYIEADEDFNILFSDECNLDYNVYISILNDCIEKELFSKKLYEKYSVLSSCRIQTNYCEATERRKEVEFIKEYLLIDILKKYNIEKINVNILTLNADICTQSRVEEKESKKKLDKKETKIEDIETFFCECWNMYPKKEGKGAISKSKKETLFKISEEFKRCITRYVNKIEVENIDKKFIKNGSTFFNSGYVDYLDENWQEEEELKADSDGLIQEPLKIAKGKYDNNSFD